MVSSPEFLRALTDVANRVRLEKLRLHLVSQSQVPRYSEISSMDISRFLGTFLLIANRRCVETKDVEGVLDKCGTTHCR